MKRFAATAAMALALSACATLPQGPVLSDTERMERTVIQQREAVAFFKAHPDWSLSGRIAVNSANGAGSGRLDWVNKADGYVATIAAPITRQTWRLTRNARGAMIEGLAGGPRMGGDAEQLLREVSGWTIPLDQLTQWMQGITPGGNDVQVDPRTGLPMSFSRGEWQVTYDEWSSAGNGLPALPKRITAKIGDATTVKLAIDQWQP